MTEQVRAAGGVVVRTGATGIEVLLVHRSRYDDWSLPKGKAEPGETDERTACREVTEETGWTVEITDTLPEVHYTDHGVGPRPWRGSGCGPSPRRGHRPTRTRSTRSAGSPPTRRGRC